MFSLKNKVVLTGSTGGIGKEIAFSNVFLRRKNDYYWN